MHQRRSPGIDDEARTFLAQTEATLESFRRKRDHLWNASRPRPAASYPQLTGAPAALVPVVMTLLRRESSQEQPAWPLLMAEGLAARLDPWPPSLLLDPLPREGRAPAL